MNDRYEQTIGNAVAKAAPALAGAGASGTFLGIGADGWAIVASIITIIYVAAQLYVFLPRIVTATRSYWRKLFGPDDSDQAGA
jgi:hypothetical protein